MAFSCFANAVKMGWEHHYLLDGNVKLRGKGTAITSDTNGSAVTSGFERGKIYTLLVNIDSCDYTDGNEQYMIWIQRYDGTSWKDIQGALIIPALAGTSPDTYSTGLYGSFFQIPKDTTQLRYRVDVEGTSCSIDLDIYLAASP